MRSESAWCGTWLERSERSDTSDRNEVELRSLSPFSSCRTSSKILRNGAALLLRSLPSATPRAVLELADRRADATHAVGAGATEVMP